MYFLIMKQVGERRGRMREGFMFLVYLAFRVTSGFHECGQEFCIDKEGVYCDEKNLKCRCPEDEIGNPTIQCVDPRKQCLCTLHGDPHVINFEHDSFSLPLPCHHLLADFTTPPNRRIPKGCKVVVTGRSEYHSGSGTTLYSYESLVEITVTTSANRFTATISENGVQVYAKSDERKRLRRIGPRRRFSRTGRITVHTGHDESDFFFVYIPLCGVMVKFRDWDGAFSVDKPIKSVGDDGICGTCDSTLSPGDPVDKPAKNNIMQRFLKALVNFSPIDNLNANVYDSCNSLTDLQKSCDASKKDAAIGLCRLMMQDPATNGCMVAKFSIERTLQHFTDCFRKICAGSKPCDVIEDVFSDCAGKAAVNAYKTKHC